MARPSKATLRRRAKAAPRYTSGPKKGQFKPRGAKKRRRRKTAAKKTVRRRRRRVAVSAAPKRRRTGTKRSAAAKKAARTRAANKRKRSAAGKKAARTRKLRKSVAHTRSGATLLNPRRRRRKARRNPVARRRKRRVSMATRKKISRALKRRRRGNPSRRRKNPVRRSKRTGRFVRSGGKRRKGSRLSKQSVYLAPKPRARVKRYRVRRSRRTSKSGTSFYTYSLARQNPGGALKGALMAGLGVFGGVLAARTTGALLAKYVLPKLLPATTSASTARWVGALLPGLSMFLLATFVAPKVIKGKPNVVRGLQMGSVVALADGLVNALVAGGTVPASVAPFVQGPGVQMSGFGAFQYSQPLADYVDYDNRLGEYVDLDNRYGGEASEPLALGADELAYFQSGGAGGVFSNTVFKGVG